ncbi:MAG: hypothetical protein RL026_560 [Pseudomonadota bacterium]|jgi:hypothetical protein
MAEAPQQQQALFYTNPQPLNTTQHGNWRLKDGDASFTKDAMGLPVVMGEFADASRFFPVLFAAGDDAGPVALIGVDRSNLFVDDKFWAQDIYIPAYVRRHPFGLMQMNAEGTELALCIDADSPRFAQGGEEGQALFGDDQQPSEFTKNAMQFCQAYSAESAQTLEFRRALTAKGLLVDRRVDGTLPGGQKIGIDGFQIVDTEKLQNLDDATIAEWHRKGYLAAVFFHLASLARIGDLMARKARRMQAQGQAAAQA